MGDRLAFRADQGELLEQLGNVTGAESNFAVDFDCGELARLGHSLDPPSGQTKRERQTGRGQQVDEHGFASRECARLERRVSTL